MTGGFGRDFGMALIAAALIALLTEPADAAGRRDRSGYPIVVAYSNHGHGEIAAEQLVAVGYDQFAVRFDVVDRQ